MREGANASVGTRFAIYFAGGHRCERRNGSRVSSSRWSLVVPSRALLAEDAPKPPAAQTPPTPAPPPAPPVAPAPAPADAPKAPGAAGGEARGPEIFDAPDVDVRYVPPDNIVRTTAKGEVPIAYPGGRDILDKQILETYPFNNAVEVVRRVPGVYSQIDSGGGAYRLNIGIRGSDSRRSGFVAVLVDGVPVNPAPYGSIDMDVFPVALQVVDRIDVIRGGAQVRYGPSSAGGVVNFITHPIPDCGSEVAGRQRVRQLEPVERVRHGVDGPGEVGLPGVERHRGRRRLAREQRLSHAGHVGEAAVPARRQDDHLRLGHLLHARRRGERRPHAGRVRREPPPVDPQGRRAPRQLRHLRPERRPRARPSWTLTLLGYYYDQYRSFDSSRPVVAPYTKYRYQTALFDNWTVEGRIEGDAVLGGKNHHFYQSLRYADEDNHLYYHFTAMGGGPVIPPHEQNNDFYTHAWASFTEDTIDLSCRWHLGLGVRFEHIAMGSKNRDSLQENSATHDVVLPAATLTYDTEPQGALYASYQQSFVPAQFDSFDPATVAFRPIDPELCQIYEIGGRVRRCGFEGAFAIFDNEYTDKITILNDPNGLKVYSNTGLERHYGIELSGTTHLGDYTALKGVSVYATWTEMRAEILNGPFEGNDAPNAPHHLGSWGVEYQHPGCGLWARLGGTYTGGAFKEAANLPVGSANGVSGPQPAFTLWDVAAGWRARADGTGFAASVARQQPLRRGVLPPLRARHLPRHAHRRLRQRLVHLEVLIDGGPVSAGGASTG